MIGKIKKFIAEVVVEL